MNSNRMSQFFTGIQNSLKKHTPELMIGMGLTGMFSMTVLAVGATPKALRAIEQKKELEGKDKLTKVETVKVTWKYYLPAAITGATSAACIIGGNSVHLRRNAALAAAY